MRQGVYAIRCLETDRVYVGSSSRIESRIKEHTANLCNGKHRTQRLQAAWNESTDPQKQFVVEVLEEVAEQKDLVAREAAWIAKLKATNPESGFNLRSARQKGQTIRTSFLFPDALADVLRRIASDESRTLTDIVMEGLDYELERRGRPTTDKLGRI